MPGPLPASPLSPTSLRHIVCLGDVMIDIVATLPGPLALGSDVHAPISYVPGGSAANTAAWLAKVGATVTLVGRVGDDAMGAQAHLDLSERGITDRLATDRDRATGTCIVLVDSDGERTMIPDPGANVALVPDDLDPAAFTRDGHLHVSGYALLGWRPSGRVGRSRPGPGRWHDHLGRCRVRRPPGRRGRRRVRELDRHRPAALRQPGRGRGAHRNRRSRAGGRLLSRRFGYAVVKAGADGAYWSDGTDAITYLPAVQLTKVRRHDRRGRRVRGDVLSRPSALATTPATALQQAIAMAAVACVQIGGRPPSTRRTPPGETSQAR